MLRLRFRYVLLMVLIGCALSDAYKRKNPRRREHYQSEPDYGDYDDYAYPVSGYGKDSESGNERPSIFSYWNNLLRRARLPRFNITNPFTRLFTPYVIKVGFPEDTDPNADSQPNRNRDKNKDEQQEDYIYINPYENNVGAESGQYFYDPVTQQYYEVQETASQDYNPQNNYYATTFNDDDEIVINLGDQDGKDESTDDADEEERLVGQIKKVGYMGKYNSPALRTLKTKRFSIERRSTTSNNRKRAKRTGFRKATRLAVL